MPRLRQEFRVEGYVSSHLMMLTYFFGGQAPYAGSWTWFDGDLIRISLRPSENKSNSRRPFHEIHMFSDATRFEKFSSKNHEMSSSSSKTTTSVHKQPNIIFTSNRKWETRVREKLERGRRDFELFGYCSFEKTLLRSKRSPYDCFCVLKLANAITMTTTRVMFIVPQETLYYRLIPVTELISWQLFVHHVGHWTLSIQLLGFILWICYRGEEYSKSLCIYAGLR